MSRAFATYVSRDAPTGLIDLSRHSSAIAWLFALGATASVALLIKLGFFVATRGVAEPLA